MKKYTLTNEPGKVNIFAGAFRRILWYVLWFLRKSKHYIHRVVRKILSVTHRHPYIEKKRQRRAVKDILHATYSIPSSNHLINAQDLILIIRDSDHYPKSSAFIRLIAPLSLPEISERYNIRIYNQSIKAENITPGSICIVQRTAFDSRAEAETILSAIRTTGSTLIVDNDDAFSLLDSTHSEHSHIGEKSDALELLAENADELWVSTDNLARLNPVYISKTKVMFNTLDDRLWKPQEDSKVLTGPIRIVYMGTATHDADFKMILPALDNLHDKMPGMFELYIIGVSPESLPDKPWLNRLYQPRGHALYPKFVDWFQQQGPFDIGLCPLIKSPFNDAKSDIKCLDYIASNIHPVASDVPAYQTPGLQEFITLVNNSVDDWESTLAHIVNDPEGFRLNINDKKSAASVYLKNERSNEAIARIMSERLALYSSDKHS